MFNQVKVPTEDADALRLLWWEDINLEWPSKFQMNNPIFGATDSPSCANFSLKRAAEVNKENFSEDAGNAVEWGFYVNDFIKTVETVEEAKSLANEVTSLLSEYGFRLTKRMSNSRDVLSVIPGKESLEQIYVKASRTERMKNSFAKIEVWIWNSIPRSVRLFCKSKFSKAIKKIRFNTLELEDNYTEVS